jgi:hypothetical protein
MLLLSLVALKSDYAWLRLSVSACPHTKVRHPLDMLRRTVTGQQVALRFKMPVSTTTARIGQLASRSTASSKRSGVTRAKLCGCNISFGDYSCHFGLIDIA